MRVSVSVLALRFMEATNLQQARSSSRHVDSRFGVRSLPSSVKGNGDRRHILEFCF